MKNNIACITGITGQDGSYLASSLLSRGYTVVGLHRRSSTNNFYRIESIKNHPSFILEEFDLTDPSVCNQLVSKYKPKEFYNLAAQSHVGTSFKQPTTTFEINTVGVTNILESIKNHSIDTRLYQASTSEMFGSNFSTEKDGKRYQNETTNFSPQSPYAISKVASHNMIRLYRESYGIYACSGILFNHESPRRGENFVTRKITKWIGEFLRWKAKYEVNDNQLSFHNDKIQTNESSFNKLRLGNLNAHRDWGHAKDYVEAMRMMLNQNNPEDFVIATGKTHTVKDFLKEAFDYVGLDYEDYVYIDKDLYRPAEVNYLLGDFTKAKKQLGWTPQVAFEQLVHEMINHDLG